MTPRVLGLLRNFCLVGLQIFNFEIFQVYLLFQKKKKKKKKKFIKKKKKKNKKFI